MQRWEAVSVHNGATVARRAWPERQARFTATLRVTETLATYRKIVKLPAGSVEAARHIREALDEQVHQAVVDLTAREPALQVTRSTDDWGNQSLRASANGYDIVIATRSGQDSTFQAGERRAFFSYTLSATTSLRSLDCAATVSREVGIRLRGIGALLFAGLFFWGIAILLGGSGMPFIHIPIIIIVVVVLAGAWIGERLGAFLGARLESRALSRAERVGSLPQLESVWSQLERRFQSLLASYEHV